MKNFINGRMSPSTYVNLLGDAGFKAVYADQSNKSCLINLINCILPEDVRVRDIIAITDFKDKSDDAGKWNKDDLTDIYEMTSRHTGKVAPPTIFINFAKLAYFTKTLDECTSDRDYLFYWFLNGWKFDKDSLPKELQKSSAIQQLAEACEIAAFTPDKRIIYDNKLMTELDIQAQKDYAVKEALAEGRAEGKAERDLEIAKNMLAEGMNKTLISKLTGLSESILQSL